ncbi:hypothetical protein GCM10007854_13340 [Algimonas porphyrae]|uniref:Uncharacterized protein n=2 Tax=Algimonas porphyrae TaxID=1128113 RepID=A0ABQ5UZN7_9PROT|nr:hypothetical protein GCM10007854_13340 [Algimonas porphyrae]
MDRLDQLCRRLSDIGERTKDIAEVIDPYSTRGDDGLATSGDGYFGEALCLVDRAEYLLDRTQENIAVVSTTFGIGI